MQSSGVVPLLTNLSCRGTSFSLQWLLRDLEVLSLKLYKAKKDLKETKSEKSSQSKSKPDTGTNAPTTPSTPSTPSLVSQEPQSQEGQDPLEGLDDITRACFETIHEAVQAPLPVLRAIYESVGQDRGKLLEKVQRSFDGSGFQVSDELRESAKKWERPVEKPEVVEPSLEDAAIDLGVVRYRPDDLKPKTLEAKVEDAEMVQKLIPTLSEVEIEETREKQARTKSSELLRKELDKERKPGSTDYLRKVNLALSIIYARHMMAALFSDWPEEEPITSQLLDKCDEVQLIGLLDLLQRQESKEQFEKVVAHVVRQGDTGLIQPLSLAAAHCMGEVTLSSETKESDHKYKNNSKAEGCVHIRGAATLSIKFDPRCSTEEGCDELIISTSPDYQQNRHVFSGSQGRWIDLELPGDTLYYRFTSDSSNNDWGWKFVVTGGQFGRFKTGFSVLNALLSLDNKVARTLPLKKLWGWLVFVACCQTGQQRLMATGLLLRLLLVVSGQAVDSEGTISLPVEASERPDLSRLKPLWTLYTKMLEKETATGSAPTIVPPAVRGFTELFLVVENLAQDWGMAEDLIVGFTTAESLKRSFAQAVQKVGLLGLAIGMPNKASEALIEAASRPPEEKQVEKTTPKQEKAKSRSSSHSDGDIPIVLNTLDLNEDDTTTSSDNDDTSDDEIYEDMGAW